MKKQKRSQGAGNKRQGRRGEDVGAEVEVIIERILPGGAGLAHAGGRTILVALAAPGDRLRVRLERVSAKLAFASIEEVIAASPLRVEPPCPYFGRCGGCDFQQLSYEAQLAAKVEIIRDCLRRIARIEPPAEIPITPSPLDWHYRSRAEWQYDSHQHRLGYFERGSHRICDVAECPVIVPRLQATLSDLRERMRDGSLPAEVEEFRAVAGDDQISLAPPLREGATVEATRTIGDYRYRFSADGFFQINHELLPHLISAAIADAHGARAVDLYCGAGLFTLPLAHRFTHVFGIEAHPAAMAYARRNLNEAGFTNVAIECARVSDWLADNSDAIAPVDYLLLDPPRTGAEEGAIAGILSLHPQRIAYVSCDPATLARDLKQLLGGGYTLDSLAAFDMFPQTHHVETVAHLASQYLLNTKPLENIQKSLKITTRVLENIPKL